MLKLEGQDAKNKVQNVNLFASQSSKNRTSSRIRTELKRREVRLGGQKDKSKARRDKPQKNLTSFGKKINS